MSAMPDDSTAKFGDTGSQDAMDADVGNNFQQDDSAGSPALMLTSGQAEAAGMSGAQPGDKYTVTVTVATQADDGWNVSLDPGSAVKMPGPDDATTSGANASDRIKGPSDFGMPTGLGADATPPMMGA